LFDPDNLFHQFHMRGHLIDLVAQGLQCAGQGSALHEAVATSKARGNDTPTVGIQAALDEIAVELARPGRVCPMSFIERVVRLKDSVTSTEQRAVVERYLNVGF
jgi:hypothetical protein